MPACSVCGRALHDRDRNVRFRLPDPVLQLPDRDDGEGVWKSEADPSRAVMMMVPNLGGFLRALFPVHLSGGDAVTFGVWVGVHPDDLKRAYDVWWDAGYPKLSVSGRLANALPGWGLVGAAVDLEVVDPKATPYCVRSSDAELSSVLTDEWDREDVLARLPN
ncbi:DUF2199 domain-containing protein [Phycicoccus sp.]|uniref:DUF2199 domain-containing protein n=1 Tax=Phycicoccus sp. TaxID=1902410 RepID=UPI002B9FB1BD|nr:DUF2199 domain-containing protein [Phycicoccus sp.]HMM96806.1 DUF2199 domain-containing protein [Phycicoccus sp.]